MERDTAFCNPHFFFQVRQSTTCVTIINVFFFQKSNDFYWLNLENL